MYWSLSDPTRPPKAMEPLPQIKRHFDPEPQGVRMPRKTLQLQVSLPKCLFGFKEKKNGLDARQLLRRDVTTKLMLETLLGSSSPLYQRLYDDGLIPIRSATNIISSTDYGFSIIGGDTPNPDELIARIKEAITATIQSGIDEAAFERIKRKHIGGYLRMLNSPESIAESSLATNSAARFVRAASRIREHHAG